eukprot:952198-Rhodomonas_salina.5
MSFAEQGMCFMAGTVSLSCCACALQRLALASAPMCEQQSARTAKRGLISGCWHLELTSEMLAGANSIFAGDKLLTTPNSEVHTSAHASALFQPRLPLLLHADPATRFTSCDALC